MLIQHPNKIVVHHSLTADGPTVSWRAIRDYHINHNGWRDIGYHFGIELVGQHYEILLGRMPTEQGAHTFRHNKDSIGICCVGNFDMEVVSAGQWVELLRLCRYLMQHYNISWEDVYGHGELTLNKSCPGKNFDMSELRRILSRDF